MSDNLEVLVSGDLQGGRYELTDQREETSTIKDITSGKSYEAYNKYLIDPVTLKPYK